MGLAATVVGESRDLRHRTERLIREFAPTLAAGAVIRSVVGCRAELLRTGTRGGLAAATEERVREELRAAAAALPSGLGR
jgi:hypothetical protein